MFTTAFGCGASLRGRGRNSRGAKPLAARAVFIAADRSSNRSALAFAAVSRRSFAACNRASRSARPASCLGVGSGGGSSSSARSVASASADHLGDRLRELLHRAVRVDRGVRTDLRAVERDHTQPHEPSFRAEPKRVDEQFRKRLRVSAAEPGDRHVVRRQVASQHPERNVFNTTPFDHPRRPHTGAVRVQQQRDHHRRVIRRPAMPIRSIHAKEPVQVDLIDDVDHEPGQVILRQPVRHVRRHQELLRPIRRHEVVRHRRIMRPRTPDREHPSTPVFATGSDVSTRRSGRERGARGGFEPAGPRGQRILSPPCLPFHHPGVGAIGPGQGLGAAAPSDARRAARYGGHSLRPTLAETTTAARAQTSTNDEAPQCAFGPGRLA